MNQPVKAHWRKRAEDNASFKFHLAEWIHARRKMGKGDAAVWAERVARIFPMRRHPELMDRIGRSFDWIIARTKPRNGYEVAADRPRGEEE